MQLSLAARIYHAIRGPNPLHPKIWFGRLRPLEFRRFQAADLQQCLELYAENEPGRFPEGGKEDYKRRLLERTAYVLVVEEHGRIVACGGISYFLRKDVAVLSYGFVRPDCQGKGIGTALVLARLSLLKPLWLGYRVLIFAVAKSFGFYRRLGFEPSMPWHDQHGQDHPSGVLTFGGRDIKNCRKLLAAHNISVPPDEDLIPLNEPKLEAAAETVQ